MAKRVLLLGAGPTHLRLLQALARQPLAGAQLALVSPFAQQVHQPLLASVVAGRRRAAEACIALPALAAAAQVHFSEGQVQALDAGRPRVRLQDGRQVDFDILSVDAGPAQDRSRIPGARERGLFLHPAEHFLRLLDGLWDLAARRVLDVVVVGDGVEAVELALLLAQRLAQGGEERARVALVTDAPGTAPPLAGCSAGLRQRGLRALARSRVTLFHDRCLALEPGAVRLQSGARLACDAPVLATPAERPGWLQGLQSNGITFDVSATAAGGARHLESLLRHAVGGAPVRPPRPPRSEPCFMELGEGRAAVAWGGWSAQGRWVLWWKRRRDVRFMAQFPRPSP